MTAKLRGRPPGARTKRGDGTKQRASVRLTDAEFKRLRVAVAASGQTMLDFVADAVMRAVDGRTA